MWKKDDARIKPYEKNRQRTFKEGWKTGEKGEARNQLRFHSNRTRCSVITASLVLDWRDHIQCLLSWGADKLHQDNIKAHEASKPHA